MGVEVVGFEMVQGPVEIVTGVEMKENGELDEETGVNVPIKFGSHDEEPVKEKENGVAENNFPKDAVDEWPAPKQIHSFYFIRCRPFDDPKIKAKIDLAAIEIEKRTQARLKLMDALKAKRSDRAELISQIKALKDDNRQFRSVVDEKLKEIEPLQQALGKLRNANSASRNGGLCSSEEELNATIHSFQYRIQHESIPLSEEKLILKEIKQLEGTREKVIANAATRAQLQDSMVPKEVLQDHVKLIGGNLDGVRREQQTVRAKIKEIDDTLKAIDRDIASLQDELKVVTERRDKARESVHQLRKQRDEDNANFYQSRAIMNKARELAAKKDVKALEDLSQAEVDKFMSCWSSNKAFRDDYEKRILSSLDSRQMSRDGRIRNPNEKPLVAPEELALELMTKANSKQIKEESKPSEPAAPIQKVQKEAKKKPTELKPSLDHTEVADKEISLSDKVLKDTPKQEKEIDQAKLKEMKREEEIAKAKQAMERKRKMAEKAAAKATLRAQKEAEKKNKEREKKAKKKEKASQSAPDTNPEEPEEAEVEVVQPEKATTEDVEALAPTKEKVQKETFFRHRSRPKGPETVRKVILKRKKSSNYWMWAAPTAVLVLLVLALGYYYLFLKE